MQIIPRFIVIDDDPINNFICRKNIQKVFADADILTFTAPEAGLAYLASEHCASVEVCTILYIDINMPSLSGWEVLHRFAGFPVQWREQFDIYIFSSSIAKEDNERAKNSPLVKGFIEKPLSVSIVEQCVLNCQL